MFAVAALAACTSEQTIVAPQNEAIGFDTFVDNSTRAEDITTNNIANFGVYGTVTKGGNSALIFDNTKVEKNGTAYTYSPAQYWIAAAQYDFLAFAPYQDGEGATWTYAPTNAQVAKNGTFSFDNAAAAANQDVVYAYQTKTTEAALTAKPEAVKFTFKHILSKVAFSFTNTFNDDNITTLKVYNVKINNTAETGTMAIANGEDAAWNGVGDLVVPFGAKTADATTALANGKELKLDHHYVIPAQRAYNITFSVDLYQAGVYLATYNHEINSAIDFAKNGNYVLSVKLAPESIDPANPLFPIEFSVNEVKGWDDASISLNEFTEVDTEAELKAAIKAGVNVKLTANIALAESVLVKDVTSVIDLNGFNLVAESTDAIVVEGANLTINGNGDVKAATDDKSSANALWVKYGNVVINGGNYYVGADNAVRNDCIYLGAKSLKDQAANYVSSITINGGTFEAKVNEAGQYWVLNVQDDFYTAGSDIVVYGGSYKNFNPADNKSEGAGTNFLAPGKTVEQSGDWYIVKKSTDILGVGDWFSLHSLCRKTTRRVIPRGANLPVIPRSVATRGSTSVETQSTMEDCHGLKPSQ